MFKIRPAPKTGKWLVYILACRGGRLYTGVTNNLEQRLAAHKAGKGARFTRAFAPVKLAAVLRGYSRSGALRLEAAIKKLSREEKEGLVAENKPA
jgi:putative endonuclease